MTAEPARHRSAVGGTNPCLVATAVMLATFMEVLDTSIAAVALPYIAGNLSATNDEATWVLTSYLVANAVVLPASNWFSLRFERKRFHRWYCSLHDFFLRLWVSHNPGRDPDRTSSTGRWRRSAATVVASDPAGKLASSQTGPGYDDLPLCGGSSYVKRARSPANWMASA